MGLLDRFTRARAGRGAARRERRRVPTFSEMRARMRTERAEAKLMETEARIHREAARIRHDVRASR
ncbi:hypothetical protein [Actinomadura kijaniata]|uniref:hypothetical protein n=1 Tax=Actinomadura kijaniata TaxID=46161 RepID=UPI00082E2CFD|nr:hypothetical protein [Actinomadura kijaniata]